MPLHTIKENPHPETHEIYLHWHICNVLSGSGAALMVDGVFLLFPWEVNPSSALISQGDFASTPFPMPSSWEMGRNCSFWPINYHGVSLKVLLSQ